MTATRAKAGGEIGVNGEFYFGGEFLPSSEKTVKGEIKKVKGSGKPRKQQIEPYVWEYAPADDMYAIFSIVDYCCLYNRQTKQFSWGKFENNEAFKEEYGNHKFGEYTRFQLIEMFNNGERWYRQEKTK